MCLLAILSHVKIISKVPVVVNKCFQLIAYLKYGMFHCEYQIVDDFSAYVSVVFRTVRHCTNGLD